MKRIASDERLLAVFESDMAARRLRPKTKSTYTYWASRYRQYAEENGFALLSATTADVKGFLAALMATGISAGTARLVVAVVRMFYECLTENEVIRKNPARKIRVPKPERPFRPVLNAEQIALIVGQFNRGRFCGYRNYCLTMFMLDTMARISEACRLRLSDLDLERRTATIRQAKNGEDRRVPLSPAMVEIFREYLTEWRTPYSGDYVFCFTSGKVFDPHRIRQEYYWISDKVGFRVHAHLFRATGATTMLKNGANLETVRRILGHRSLAVTHHYLSLDMEYLQDEHDQHSALVCPISRNGGKA